MYQGGKVGGELELTALGVRAILVEKWPTERAPVFGKQMESSRRSRRLSRHRT